MSERIVYLRKGGQTRRLVGPHAEALAAQREAEGWERFAPPRPHGAPEPEPEPEPVPGTGEQPASGEPAPGEPAGDEVPAADGPAGGEEPVAPAAETEPKRPRRGKGEA